MTKERGKRYASKWNPRTEEVEPHRPLRLRGRGSHDLGCLAIRFRTMEHVTNSII